MTYHDISGKLEINSSANQKELIERLFASFHVLKVNVTVQEDSEVTFKVPLLKTVMRGNIFQGISSGLVRIEQSGPNILNLEYKLVTFPMRLSIIIMALWITIGIPAISLLPSEGFNPQKYILFELPAIVMLGSVFLAGRFFIRYKFVAFIRKSLYGKADVIKQPVFGKYFDIKKIIIFSCSGVLFVTLLIPAIIIFSMINIRSKVIWRYPIQNAIVSAPIISEEIAYFGSLNDVNSAAFYALDATSGKEIWVKPLDGAVSSSPILTGNSVCFGTDDGFFYCLDRKNGKELWEFSPEQRDLDSATCDRCALRLNAPAIDKETIYIGSQDHNLYALDAKTGQLKWHFVTDGSIMDAPAIVSDTIYIGSYDGYVYSLDKKSGTEIRRYLVPNADTSEMIERPGVYATPLIDETAIYAVNGSLTAIDIVTGEIIWQTLGTSSYEDQIVSRPLLIDDFIIVTTTNALYAIDKASGKTRWKYARIKGDIFFSPTLYKDIVYFGDSSGYLYGVYTKTGWQAFRYNMNYLDLSSYTNWFAEFVFSPAVDDHRIYVKWFNHLYAIKNDNK